MCKHLYGRHTMICYLLADPPPPSRKREAGTRTITHNTYVRSKSTPGNDPHPTFTHSGESRNKKCSPWIATLSPPSSRLRTPHHIVITRPRETKAKTYGRLPRHGISTAHKTERQLVTLPNGSNQRGATGFHTSRGRRTKAPSEKQSNGHVGVFIDTVDHGV